MIVKLPRYFKRDHLRMTGIYFLFRRGKLIYIGESTNLTSRISQHLLKEYDFVRFIQCDEKNLRYYENRWVDRFYRNGKFRKLKIVRDGNKIFAERIA